MGKSVSLSASVPLFVPLAIAEALFLFQVFGEHCLDSALEPLSAFCERKGRGVEAPLILSTGKSERETRLREGERPGSKEGEKLK